jgi:hypothetical protein
MKLKRPLGVIIFGLILIVTSLDLLRHMPTYAFYAQVNHEWTGPFLRIRFIGSYIFRIIGLACGIGVLGLSQTFRKILIWFSWYCLITLPLRHTYSAQLFFSEPLYRQNGSMFSLQTFTWIAVVVRWIIDGVFSLSVIYYFTRPKVINIFTSSFPRKRESITAL